MCNVDPLSISSTLYLPIQEEVQSKHEEEQKEKVLPYNVLKTALAISTSGVLSPVELHKKVSYLLTNLSTGSDNELLPNMEKDPILFKSISILVDIYKRIHIESEISDKRKRDATISTLCRDLLAVGDIYKAFKLAETTSRPARAIKNICQDLTICDFDKAVEVVKILDPKEEKGYLKSISGAFIAVGNFEKAIEACNRITHEGLRAWALKDIENIFIKRGDLEKAAEIASSITQSNVKRHSFRQIINFLIKAGNFDKAMEVTQKIPEISIQGIVLCDIFKALKDLKIIDKALEVANQIPEPVTQGFVLWDISRACKNLGDINRASELAKAALEAIGDLGEAIKVANTLDNDCRDRALEYIIDITLSVVNIPNISKAFEIANTIYDNTHKGDVLVKLTQLLQLGQSGG